MFFMVMRYICKFPSSYQFLFYSRQVPLSKLTPTKAVSIKIFVDNIKSEKTWQL